MARNLRFTVDAETGKALSNIRNVDQAFENLSQKLNGQSPFEKMERSAKDFGKQGEKSAEDVERALRRLGVRSEQTADKQKRSLIEAYEAIEKSGTASAQEIERAYSRLQERLERIDRSVGRTRETLGQRLARRLDPRPAIDQAGRLRNAVSGIAGTAGRIGAVGTAAGLAGIGLSVRTFTRIEDGLVAVQKTANLTEEQTQDLKNRIFELSETIPVAQERLLGIAEAAGQLGVTGVPQIATFAETIARFSSSASDIGGAEAAQSLQRLLNIAGESTDNIEGLASAIVRLGNDFATTEGRILKQVEQIGAATSQFGVASEEIAAIATLVDSLGQRSEAAASTIQRLFSNLEASLNDGSFAKFAAIAGQTEEAFANLLRNNPADALAQILEGFNRLRAEGRGSRSILELLGLDNQTAARVLPTIASNVDEFRRQLASVREESTGEPTALIQESQRAFATASSDFQRLQNRVTQTAEGLGEDLTPAVLKAGRAAVDLGQEIRDTFSDELSTGIDQVTRGLDGLNALIAGEQGNATAEWFRSVRQDLERIAAVAQGVKTAFDAVASAGNAVFDSAQDAGAAASDPGLGNLATQRLRDIQGLTPTQDRDPNTGLAPRFQSRDTVFGVGVELFKQLAENLGLLDRAVRETAQSVQQTGERIDDGTGTISGRVVNRASGGMVYGPGGPTSDSITARLSSGEFVQRAAAVNYYGTELMNRLNAMAVPREQIAALANSAPQIRLPDPPQPDAGFRKFAEGGLVEGTGGGGTTTLRLDLGGQSFDMSADQQTVRDVERHVRKTNRRRSSGVPDWFPR